MTPPLIKGGQGRSDDDVAGEVKAWREVTVWTLVAAFALACGIAAISMGGGA